MLVASLSILFLPKCAKTRDPKMSVVYHSPSIYIYIHMQHFTPRQL